MRIFKRKEDGKLFGVSYSDQLFEVELKYTFADPWDGEVGPTTDNMVEDEWEEVEL